MKSDSLQPYIPGILALSVFAVYLKTICPAVYLGDSGEYTAAAFCLGIPHNSGYPLYSLLGKLFCFIPIGHVGFRLNLMSTVFAVLSVWLVYAIILRLSSSVLSAVVGALLLAFAPVFWFQTVSAEVYTLHVFFVALLTRLLLWWDESRTFPRLAVFVLVTGISFGNHMQTVMLAPAVLFLIFSADYRALCNVKSFCLLSVLFVCALMVYLYLPIRTEVGAAIHSGDPNTLERFLAHVTAQGHRQAYVMTKGLTAYLDRTREAIWFVGRQFGVALLFAFIGWLKLGSVRWRVFFAGVILFDFIYTVFLNIVSLDITPFGLSTCVVLAVLAGRGIAWVLQAAKERPAIGAGTRNMIHAAVCALPAIPFAFSLGLCDQSRNYTAYEHALNLFRTVSQEGTLFLEGDNNLFPATYGRIVENMREDVDLYDRYDLFFKMPFPDNLGGRFQGSWETFRPMVETRIIEKARGEVFFATMNPWTVPVPDQYSLLPYGILYRVSRDDPAAPPDMGDRAWKYYATESISDDYYRDFMNEETAACFHFAYGKYLFMINQPAEGLRSMELASQITFDETMIHADIGVFLTDRGFYEEAEVQLRKASMNHGDNSRVHSNWGYHYFKRGRYDRAAESYGKALEGSPRNALYQNNLGLALYHGGRKEEAEAAFKKSLALKKDQPKIRRFLKTGGMVE